MLLTVNLVLLSLPPSLFFLTLIYVNNKTAKLKEAIIRVCFVFREFKFFDKLKRCIRRTLFYFCFKCFEIIFSRKKNAFLRKLGKNRENKKKFCHQTTPQPFYELLFPSALYYNIRICCDGLR